MDLEILMQAQRLLYTSSVHAFSKIARAREHWSNIRLCISRGLGGASMSLPPAPKPDIETNFK